jgi:hypothetical protein
VFFVNQMDGDYKDDAEQKKESIETAVAVVSEEKKESVVLLDAIDDIHRFTKRLLLSFKSLQIIYGRQLKSSLHFRSANASDIVEANVFLDKMKRLIKGLMSIIVQMKGYLM